MVTFQPQEVLQRNNSYLKSFKTCFFILVNVDKAANKAEVGTANKARWKRSGSSEE